ncbi:hypothetical protein GQF61_07680 [Sphingobacterium sp. DK4209]|uniref:Uncharacterized protein n=2 Tax=Sphingobacterium zhuxiongii TaxID=2662364 RepID=A0A5Q0QF58_9SPHI|nr:hypothetical protein [Sphingobacterium sp. dk4302]MVZ65735.1 hypothetical protein [Sphingobacterium sp. DK4209]QGA27934.1 hypothetical protein GFH32_17075 [Sphingobacterium sp. dk4302]
MMGITLSFARSTYQSPTHYNTTPGLSTPVWAAIPADKLAICDEQTDRLCTAVLVNGNFIPTANRGLAVLIDAE